MNTNAPIDEGNLPNLHQLRKLLPHQTDRAVLLDWVNLYNARKNEIAAQVKADSRYAASTGDYGDSINQAQHAARERTVKWMGRAVMEIQARLSVLKMRRHDIAQQKDEDREFDQWRYRVLTTARNLYVSRTANGAECDFRRMIDEAEKMEAVADEWSDEVAGEPDDDE